MRYRISEVFRSVQGEASHTGTPSAFIRLHGCSVGCPWCDTPYTWRDPVEPVDFQALVEASKEAAVVASASVDMLCDWVAAQNVQHVVITGGEPLEQDLLPLVEALPFVVQVETSGTVAAGPELARAVDWWTVSPKVGMPGGLAVRPEMLRLASEIKMPVSRESDIETLKALLVDAHPCVPVWLQPLSLSKRATRLCVDAAGLHGWRVSLQTHKMAGMR